MIKYGWKRDKYDYRDLKYFLTAPIKVPDTWDLRKNDDNILNQGSLGSCVANGFSGMIDSLLKSNKKISISPSRLFTYYNCRVLINTVKKDSGAYVRDSIKSGVNLGMVSETLYPYIIPKFKNKPPVNVYKEALKIKVTEYRRVNNLVLTELKSAICQGYPIIFGMDVYGSFESEEVKRTGIVSLPAPKEDLLGGHCMLIVGYTKDNFIVKNSWGTEWGDKGYCYIPFEYLTSPKLADDFWIVTKLNVL